MGQAGVDRGVSPQARAYYFAGVIRPIADHTGYTVKEAHREMVRLHLDPDCDGYERDSTVGLSSRDFYWYVETVRAWAREELGVVTEEPRGQCDEPGDEEIAA